MAMHTDNPNADGAWLTYCRSIDLEDALDKVCEENKMLRDALAKTDAYWKACAAQWDANDGRVVETKDGAVVVGGNLDELANIAGRAIQEAMAKVSND